MTAATGGSPRLALDDNRDRLIAMLSVVRGGPVDGGSVFHHVEAAARHWECGDKALANLRLVIANLPRLTDAAAGERLRLAEDVLDGGTTPQALMKVLWPDARPLGKYNPNEPRVPAGNSIESGRWQFGGATPQADHGRDARIVVAAEDVPDKKDEVPHGHHGFAGRPEVETSPAQVRVLDPVTGLPAGGATGVLAGKVSTAAKAAAEIVGPGRGPVYGTAVHTELKGQIKALAEPTLHSEQSYLNNRWVKYGIAGSIRVDAVEGEKERPHTVYDLKTGSAYLTDARVRQFREHLPNGDSVDIRGVRP